MLQQSDDLQSKVNSSRPLPHRKVAISTTLNDIRNKLLNAELAKKVEKADFVILGSEGLPYRLHTSFSEFSPFCISGPW